MNWISSPLQVSRLWPPCALSHTNYHTMPSFPSWSLIVNPGAAFFGSSYSWPHQLVSHSCTSCGVLLGLGSPQGCPWLSKPSCMSWCLALLWKAGKHLLWAVCFCKSSTRGFPVGKVIYQVLGEKEEAHEGAPYHTPFWMSGKHSAVLQNPRGT